MEVSLTPFLFNTLGYGLILGLSGVTLLALPWRLCEQEATERGLTLGFGAARDAAMGAYTRAKLGATAMGAAALRLAPVSG